MSVIGASYSERRTLVMKPKHYWEIQVVIAEAGDRLAKLSYLVSRMNHYRELSDDDFTEKEFTIFTKEFNDIVAECGLTVQGVKKEAEEINRRYIQIIKNQEDQKNDDNNA
ncbi:MAG: hypothetical protein ABIK96_09580 [bacterium]